MKVFVSDTGDDKKCGGCNYQASTFYKLGRGRRASKKQLREGEGYGDGLCSYCMLDLLVDQKYDVSNA